LPDQSKVKTGLEVLRETRFAPLAGLRVGLLTNPSGVDSRLVSTYQIFAEAPQVNLVALFGPEHGVLATAPDAERIESNVDPRTGVPVHSLYGAHYRPTVAMFDGVDVIVCDIQDIGVRYYTYMWTMTHVLEAAGEYGVHVMILDRPNPLGGERIDGPLLDISLRSLVGRYPVPIRHGLTMGEMAQMVNALWNPYPAALTVITCEGWQRSMGWPDLPWVPPSPAMPHLSTISHYVGACLLEGTHLSEGRGTALPFEIVGAPWIDAPDLADALNDEGWPGVRFRPHTFRPFASKWAGEDCQGVQVYITDESVWQPLVVWLGVIVTIRRMYPDHFAWLPPYSAGVEPSIQHFDRLIGTTAVRDQIGAGVSSGDIVAGWIHDFAEQRRPYLLYP
jgi:uncharacterized protein YbbC (DUF1343 family)